ncbi:hypothetical protein SKAU_G00247970 [Synaphobranchus kaupii]|uniref:Small membrane A-kinase anchor protein n=1 Tax=Synaphobranchus kaupii TaxID=118154 RepID=A0A9Q1F2Q0_SYNKA|nr:hypothetical protein SKAU_G00247970 [Synaphobranchus kaupii]
MSTHEENAFDEDLIGYPTLPERDVCERDLKCGRLFGPFRNRAEDGLLAAAPRIPCSSRGTTRYPILKIKPPLPSNQCYIIYSMGCIKSKHSGLSQNAKSVEKADGPRGKHADEKAALVTAETGPGQDSPKIDPILLDYAQRLSEEIVARAVRQWVEVDSRYGDIPYIECDLP